LKEILDQADNLVKNLFESDIYKNYLEARKKLNQEDLVLIRQLKKLQKEFVTVNNNFENEKLLSNIYAKLCLANNTRRFLESELKLTEFIKILNIKLSNAIKLDYFD